MRAALLLLLFVLVGCGSEESENRDGGSPAAPARDAGDGGGDGDATASCMLDADCPPDQACLGALPGLAASGRCAARRDPGLAAECLAP